MKWLVNDGGAINKSSRTEVYSSYFAIRKYLDRGAWFTHIGSIVLFVNKIGAEQHNQPQGQLHRDSNKYGY